MLRNLIVWHFIPHSCKKLDTPSVTLGTLKLEWIEKDKYLGVIFSSDFNDDLDMDRQSKAISKAIYLQENIIINKFRNCTDNVKLQLFQTYCTNIHAAHL